MSERAFEPGFDSNEKNTALRYSFADSKINRTDVYSFHPSSKVRFLVYNRPTESQQIDLWKLEHRGLILGRPIEHDKKNQEVFMIPASARPLTFDSVERTTGTFSFNDEVLFYDIGSILAETTRTLPGKYISDNKDNLPSNIAIVEFTQPYERKVLLVPGVEHDIQDLPADFEANDVLQLYMHGLSSVLENNKMAREQSFQKGFNETLRSLE